LAGASRLGLPNPKKEECVILYFSSSVNPNLILTLRKDNENDTGSELSVFGHLQLCFRRLLTALIGGLRLHSSQFLFPSSLIITCITAGAA
jgi:hypothetical protein